MRNTTDTREIKLTEAGLLVISEFTSKTKKYSYLPDRPKKRFIDNKGRMRYVYLNTAVLETAIKRCRAIKSILAPAMDM